MQNLSSADQPGNPVLDHADYTAPTRQHELDPTDRKYIFPEISKLWSGNRLSVRGDLNTLGIAKQ